MPGLLMNGDTHHNSTTASNPSSSDDEHTNGNGNQYTYFDIFNLPPPQDGHFHLVLVDAITDLAFAQRDRIIGMTLEELEEIAYRFFGYDPEIYDVHFHYTRSCIGPLTHRQFESRFLLDFVTGNTTVPVYAHFFQIEDNPRAIELFSRSRGSIRRETRRERSGQPIENDSGSE